MNETEDWLTRYGESHAGLSSPLVHGMALPLVVLGTVGLLWALPVPEEFYAISPLLNWGSVFLMAATVYYFIISVPLAIGMLPFVVGVAAAHQWLESSPYSTPRVAAGFLLAGVLGLWWAHRRQGALQMVIRDLQLMMIGPAWVLSVLYRRMGIPT